MPQDPEKTPRNPVHPAIPPRERPRQSDDDADEHEGATETEVGDRTGPGAGYDDEPAKVDNDSGVS